MSDVVVTVPKGLWAGWIEEGDAAGDAPAGVEWGFWTGGSRPDMGPGDRVYIVAHGALRGYAPMTRIVRDDRAWVLCREAGAVAVTIPTPVTGFRGWRYRWWDLAIEVPFPQWRDPTAHSRVFGAPAPQRELF